MLRTSLEREVLGGYCDSLRRWAEEMIVGEFEVPDLEPEAGAKAMPNACAATTTRVGHIGVPHADDESIAGAPPFLTRST
jgi:hypothetical protein